MNPRRVAHRGGRGISKALRITNRERILLALEDARAHSGGYEVPRRFAQAGLSTRLGMAQSHVSRAMGALIDEGAVAGERRRVTGERRRVTTYTLTERGEDLCRDLLAALAASPVLSKGADGALERLAFEELLQRFEQTGWQRPADGLGLADLYRDAEVHDELPLLERPPDTAMPEVVDLSAEAIGLHLELAELRRAQGDAEGAANHMSRAADLHRQRGNLEGEVRAALIAIRWGATIHPRPEWAKVVDKIRDGEAKAQAALGLAFAHALNGQSVALPALDAAGMNRALSLLDDPRLDAVGRRVLLESMWAQSPGLPHAGHIGFQLFSLTGKPAILDRLESLFEAAGDGRGTAVVASLR